MPRFNFKLEPLLTHRKQIEERAQQAVAELMRQKLDIENELRRQQQGIAHDKRTMAEAITGRVDVARIRGHANQVNRATLTAQRSAFQLVELNRRIAQARDELAEATRQRKAIEVLRERKFTEWQREQDRRETAAIDELAVQRYHRKREGAAR
jgi:flagellar FliJ protein